MKTAMDPRLPTWSLKKQGNAEICRQCHDMYEESIEIDHKPKSLNLPVISATIAIIAAVSKHSKWNSPWICYLDSYFKGSQENHKLVFGRMAGTAPFILHFCSQPLYDDPATSERMIPTPSNMF